MKRIFALLCLLLSVPVWGAGDARYALVIGNAAYKNVGALNNTLNDARDVAKKLQTLGFQVTEVENADRRRLGGAVSDFLQRIKGTSAPALFYYAGHGIQVKGLNYLIPVDAELENETDVRFSGIVLNDVLDGMGGRGDEAVNLVILDACRNNPFRTASNRAIGGRGLAQVSAPSGTLILYATKPGDVASDNPGGRNGLFTQHLLEAMDLKGLKVQDVFDKVAYNVYQESDRRQSPWFEGVLYGRFYFLPPGTVPAPSPIAVPAPPPDYDYAAWQSAEHCGRPACYEAYLKSHPKGRFAAMARALLAPGQPSAPAIPPESTPVDDERALGLNRDERRSIQEALNALGQDVGAADGIWGANTRNGIKAWQRAAKLAASGYLNAETYKRLMAEAAPKLEEERKRQAAQSARRASYEPEMVLIPGGNFRMGDLAGVGDNDEKPVHRVQVRGFKLAKHEVTKGQFAAFVQASGYRTDAEKNIGGKDGCYAYKGGIDFGWKSGTSWRDPGFGQSDNAPVVCISWNDAHAYIDWLNREAGKRYRLPTEAEWEYVARAGSTSKYSFGNNESELCRYGNGADQATKARIPEWKWGTAPCDDKQPFTAPVGSYRANGFGLYDLHGNAWEWVQDCTNDNYSGAPTDGSARESGDCSRRALRGGSWFNVPGHLRSANRGAAHRENRFFYLGFRLAQD